MLPTQGRTSTEPGYRDRIAAGVTRYTPADESESLAFSRAMYGEDSIFADPAWLGWTLRQPYAGHSTPLWIYRRQGRVEGQQAGIATWLKVGDRDVPALWTTNLVVSPASRLRGIGAVLNDVACHERELALGLEVSVDARRALARAGWTDLGTVPMWVRPIVPSAFAARVPALSRARRLGRAADAAVRAVDRGLVAAARVRGLAFEEVSRFDHRADAIWRRASPAYPVIARRDATWLAWRYEQFPEEGRYRLFYLISLPSRRPLGWTVLRLQDRRGLRAGFIVDFLCEPGDTPALLAASLVRLRQEGAAAAWCLHSNPRADWALRALGFFRRDSGWPLMVHAAGLPPERAALVARRDSWFVTSGDSDVDRPRAGTVYARDLATESRAEPLPRPAPAEAHRPTLIAVPEPPDAHP